jgi:signal transduction histidine kinase
MEIERIFVRPNLDENGARSAALGRYMARSLVEADGGEIRARSGDASGLSLIVRLPISKPSA